MNNLNLFLYDDICIMRTCMIYDDAMAEVVYVCGMCLYVCRRYLIQVRGRDDKSKEGAASARASHAPSCTSARASRGRLQARTRAGSEQLQGATRPTAILWPPTTIGYANGIALSRREVLAAPSAAPRTGEGEPVTCGGQRNLTASDTC